MINRQSEMGAVLICLLLLLGLTISVQGQSLNQELDSIHHLLRDPEVSDDQRLACYAWLAHYRSDVPIDTAERYAQLHHDEALLQGNSVEIARSYGNLATINARRGDYEQSLRLRVRMHRMADSLQDSTLLYEANSELGNFHLDRMDFRNAIRYGKAAMKYLTPEAEKQRSTTYYNLGIAYCYADELDSGRRAFESGLRLAKEIGDPSTMGLHYSGMAMANYYAGNFDLGIEQVERAIELFEESNNIGQLLGAYVSLSAYLYQQDRKEEALIYGRRALELSRKVAYSTQEMTILNNMSIMLYDLGQYQKAYEYLDSFIVMRDSLFGLEKEQAIEEVRSKFDLETQQKDLAFLREKSNFAELRLEATRKYNIALAIIAFMAIILVAVLWRFNRLRERANRVLVMEKKVEDKRRVELELANQKLQFENSKAQFEILKSQVDPHFMFNALNTLTALVESEPEKAPSFVRSLSTLFRNMLELRAEHLITLSEEYRHTEAYLHLQQVRFGDNLRVQSELEEATLRLSLPPFSLQLVVENAIKHNRIFQREPLIIEISSTIDFVEVRNKINQRQDKVISTGTGIKNIRERYSLLGAPEPSFTVQDGHFIVRLPLLP